MKLVLKYIAFIIYFILLTLFGMKMSYSATPIVKRDTAQRVYLFEGTFNEYPQVEILTDGGLEEWTGDDLDNWDEAEEGSSVIEDETSDKHSGSHSAKLTIDAVGSNIRVIQPITYGVGSHYKVTFWAKGSAENRIRVRDEGSGIGGLDENPILTTDWVQYNYIFEANSSSNRVSFGRTTVTETNWHFFIDDISLYELIPKQKQSTSGFFADDLVEWQDDSIDKYKELDGKVFAREFIEMQD